MSSITMHANSISAEHFGSMAEPRMVVDAPVTPTLGTPAAFTAGALFGAIIAVTIGTQER